MNPRLLEVVCQNRELYDFIKNIAPPEVVELYNPEQDLHIISINMIDSRIRKLKSYLHPDKLLNASKEEQEKAKSLLNNIDQARRWAEVRMNAKASNNWVKISEASNLNLLEREISEKEQQLVDFKIAVSETEEVLKKYPSQITFYKSQLNELDCEIKSHNNKIYLIENEIKQKEIDLRSFSAEQLKLTQDIVTVDESLNRYKNNVENISRELFLISQELSVVQQKANEFADEILNKFRTYYNNEIKGHRFRYFKSNFLKEIEKHKLSNIDTIKKIIAQNQIEPKGVVAKVIKEFFKESLPDLFIAEQKNIESLSNSLLILEKQKAYDSVEFNKALDEIKTLSLNKQKLEIKTQLFSRQIEQANQDLQLLSETKVQLENNKQELNNVIDLLEKSDPLILQKNIDDLEKEIITLRSQRNEISKKNFIKIYHAIYQGEQTIFKRAPLLSKLSSMSFAEIEFYISSKRKINSQSRSVLAWDLCNKFADNIDLENVTLFWNIYDIALIRTGFFRHSSKDVKIQRESKAAIHIEEINIDTRRGKIASALKNNY